MKLRINKYRYFVPTVFGNYREYRTENVLEYLKTSDYGIFKTEEWCPLPQEETLVGLNS